jgi:hypothetical protein
MHLTSTIRSNVPAFLGHNPVLDTSVLSIAILVSLEEVVIVRSFPEAGWKLLVKCLGCRPEKHFTAECTAQIWVFTRRSPGMGHVTPLEDFFMHMCSMHFLIEK